jgi:hypothetical protein
MAAPFYFIVIKAGTMMIINLGFFRSPYIQR